MTEKLPSALESLIDTIVPQISSSLTIVKLDDWATEEEVSGRSVTHGLHAMLTKKNIDYALTVQKTAVEHNVVNHPQVKEITSQLLEFYEIYRDRYNMYYENQKSQLQDLILKKERGAINKDGTVRKNKSKVKLSLAEEEVKLQVTISQSMLELTNKVRMLSDLTSDDVLIIHTYNDVPIPLAMRKTAEEMFPKIKVFLNNKIQNETTSAPSSTD
jgi:hypothetical protein